MNRRELLQKGAKLALGVRLGKYLPGQVVQVKPSAVMLGKIAKSNSL